MRTKYFPWQLFWKFFGSLVALLNIINLSTIGIASYIFKFEFYTFENFLLSLCFFLFSLIGSAIFAYRLTLPMRRIILKALRMGNKKLFYEIAEESVDNDDLFQAEPGGYFELEQALDQIRKKLKRRREQLAHEREETQSLISSIEDGVVSVGPDGKLLYFNSGFAAQFLNRLQMMSSADSPLQLTQVLRDNDILTLFDSAQKTGVGGSLQKTLRTLMGVSERFFSITINPLRDPKTKEIFGVMGIFHDITEMKTAEKIRIEFVENASHELRTPLTSIKGYLETLKDDYRSGRMEQADSFLKIISKNVDRLSDLVNDLLTISTLEHGASPDFETIHPEQITADIIEKLSQLAKEKKISITCHSQNVTQLRADPGKLEQVLMNLVGNAIKYIPEGGRIDITWEYSTEIKSILLRVKDNGPGIAPEHQSRLFERFYRVDKARSREVGGTGLGLAIVKHIMQSHGGHVALRSDVGLGAEFICQFPVKN
jgi:two-component system, OmpR family, phosphate regulon sensor histidine kinase PhoR